MSLLRAMTMVLTTTLLVGGCATPRPATAPRPAGFRTVTGRGWSFAVPRGWSQVQGAPALVEVREPTDASGRATRVVLVRRGAASLAVGPEREPSPIGEPGVEPMGVRAGPAERTIQRTSSSGALGLTLRCTAPPGRDRVCGVILGTFRTAP
jgi:hypothetical protein